MTKNPLPFIDHILESIDAIEAYLKKISKKEFLTDFSASQDILIRDGILYRFMIIGEAVKYISEEIKMKFPQIPWSSMVALRNILIHNYLGIDLEIIYKIAKKDFPHSKIEFKKCLKKIKDREN